MVSNDAPSSIQKVKVQRSDSDTTTSDSVVVEEPLEIRIKKGDAEEQLGITMRTPGADLQLAAGFLWGEGFLNKPEQLISVKVCGDRSLTPRQRANVVIAEVTDDAPDFSRKMDRRFTMNSACGVCGSENISDLHKRGIQKVLPTTKSDSELSQMTELLDKTQTIFSKTGGLHAALLINPQGEVKYAKEDVGRHNAVDKVIGAALMDGLVPLSDWTLVVSGRTGYEIVQKAITAGISAMVGISAPTSLAIELADEFGLTLIAFARNGVGKRFISTIK
ncbi:MAG: formate dehydrogenase accessory sulfurtransferase FdhD [Candidatus Nanopelagicaceae bacterium]|jgi:FdhD protein